MTVLDAALRVSLVTDGAFDVTVGSLVEEWGFGALPARDHIPSDDGHTIERATLAFTAYLAPEA